MITEESKERSSIHKFVTNTKGLPIVNDHWSKEWYFVPDGHFLYKGGRLDATMSGTMYKPNMGHYLLDLPVLNGLDLSGGLLTGYSYKNHVHAISDNIVPIKGFICTYCGGSNVRKTESGFMTTTTILWCDDCKDET